MTVQLQGRQTWLFNPPPRLIATGTVAGKKEGEGPLAADFDVIHKDPYIRQKSFEAAEQRLLEEACNLAIRHAGIGRDELNLHFSGDLQNQITSSSFTARELAIPYLGLFGACSTSVQGMALAALSTACGAARLAMSSTVSHTNAVEKQFRYPNEYGAQKNATTQITVTGAGAAIIADPTYPPHPVLPNIRITSATVGKIIDLNVKDPFNMGAAMAPAACDTLLCHLKERQIRPDYYDLIVTGDLGWVGSSLFIDLLNNAGCYIPHANLTDCGKLIFNHTPKNLAGGSGCGCMAIGALGHIYRRFLRGQLKRVLLIATGALLSPLSCQQQQSIPGIAHALSWEVL